MLAWGYPRPQLLRRLEEAVGKEQARRRWNLVFVLVVCTLGDMLSAMTGFWTFVVAITLAIVILLAIGRWSLARAAPAQMLPVIDAVRDAPDRIVSVRCFLVGDIVMTRFLEIRTSTHCLTIVADDDLWIFRGLQRLCPGASFKDEVST
jgi:hypothetical protein